MTRGPNAFDKAECQIQGTSNSGHSSPFVRIITWGRKRKETNETKTTIEHIHIHVYLCVYMMMMMMMVVMMMMIMMMIMMMMVMMMMVMVMVMVVMMMMVMVMMMMMMMVIPARLLEDRGDPRKGVVKRTTVWRAQLQNYCTKARAAPCLPQSPKERMPRISATVDQKAPRSPQSATRHPRLVLPSCKLGSRVHPSFPRLESITGPGSLGMTNSAPTSPAALRPQLASCSALLPLSCCGFAASTQLGSNAPRPDDCTKPVRAVVKSSSNQRRGVAHQHHEPHEP